MNRSKGSSKTTGTTPASPSAGHRDRANSTLFGLVKYRPPRIPPNAVPRNELAMRLAASDRTLLTTVLTAAGYGKTTALAAHFEVMSKAGHLVAWVRLTEAETEPVRFLESVFASFDYWHKGMGAPALAVLRNGGDGAAVQALDLFFDRIARINKRCCLFLDDYHHAESRETNEVLLRLMEIASSNFCIKLASRFHPALDLSALRISSEISEVSTNALLFSESEIKALLGQEGIAVLSSEQLGLIERFAGGWAVGLQALVISARQRGSLSAVLARLAKSEASVSHFFLTEVVDGLSEELRWFLGATAKLGVFTADLCDEVLGIDNSASLISEIERMNLFVQPVGVDLDWLEYHDLFSEFLARQEPLAEPGKQSEANRKAYRWFATRDMHDFAIPFAIREGMWSDAADGLERCWRKMLSHSQFVALEKLITQLPEDILAERPMLQIALAWSDSLQRKIEKAAARISSIDRQIEIPPPPFVPNDPLGKALFALKAAVSNMRCDVPEIMALADIEPAKFKSFEPFDYGIILNCGIYARVIAGQLDRAHRLANIAREAMRDTNFTLVSIHCELFRGMAHEVAGDLNEAFATWSQAHELALSAFGSSYSATQSMLASIHFERGDIEAARTSLRIADAGFNGPSIVRPLILHHLTAARISVLDGQTTAAMELLGLGEELGRKEGNFELLVACLAERILLLIGQDRLSEALEIDLDELVRSDREQEHLHWAGTLAWVAIVQACLALARGDAAAANAIAEGYILRCEGTRRHGLLIQFLLLGALASHDLGRRSEAMHRFAKAIGHGKKGGYLQTIAMLLRGRPELLTEGLSWCAKNGEESLYLIRLSEALHLPRGSWIQFNSDFAEFEPVELTDRERDLIWMVSRGEANKQIARNLGISVNTVAWHLKNVFAKLGVTNRTQAVKAAQEFGLIQ